MASGLCHTGAWRELSQAVQFEGYDSMSRYGQQVGSGSMRKGPFNFLLLIHSFTGDILVLPPS